MKKNRIAGIYKITSPKGKIYIGQSVNVYSRFRSYKRIDCDRQPKIYASLKKYGFDKHKFEILAECYESELDTLESYYIELYQTFNNKYGLNLESGGRRNRQVSLETRLRLSKSLKGKPSPNKGIPMSEEQKLKISISNKGKSVSSDTREKLRNFNLGKKHSPETLLKMSRFQKGKKVSMETREKLRISNIGKVQNNKAHKLTPEIANKIREMYGTGNYKQVELADVFNISRETISNICRKKSIIWKNGI